jgi:hypothetical protein
LIQGGSLFMLVGVVFVVSLRSVAKLIGFVHKPDPAVRAGPMYVTLALTTGALLLMLLMALNASYLPIIDRRRTPGLFLVTAAMGLTGAVTGLLTLGRDAMSMVIYLALGTLAFIFIIVRDTRLTRARAGAAAGQSGDTDAARRSNPPEPRPRQAYPRSRQRRGGRRR